MLQLLRPLLMLCYGLAEEEIMATATADKTTAPIRLGYPSLRKAAEILGVNASTLSRRELDVIEMGAQTRLSARTVMEEAAYFNRRNQNEVAAELIELAEDQCPEVVDEIEREIAEYLQDLERTTTSVRPEADWLGEAKHFLPRDLFERVRRVYEQADSGGPGSLSGPAPT
jgi:tRNA(Ser,Leu) C12 N-acetylase TAN1